MIKVKTQLVTPAQDMAIGRGPWRNNSDPIIIGIGPIQQRKSLMMNVTISDAYPPIRKLTWS